MSDSGKLEAIWIKRMRRGPMAPASRATLKANRGIVGNANQGGKRQVTIIEKEVWETTMAELGAAIDPSARRANLMVSGLPLADSRGRVLQIGDCRIRIYGETKPCETMEAAWPGLQEMLRDNWKGGAFGEILNDGDIAVGDTAQWVE